LTEIAIRANVEMYKKKDGAILRDTATIHYILKFQL